MQVTKYHIVSEKIKNKKIALAADLHDRSFEAAAAAISDEKPDIIAFAGDITNRPMKDNIPAQEVFRFCSGVAPSFFCRGNHEWFFTEEDRRICEAAGVVYLDNEYRKLGDVVIGGLSSGFHGRQNEKAGISHGPEVRWLEELSRQDGYKILISHHPSYYARHIRKLDIDLVLSGHAHGGQIRIFDRGVFYPDGGFFPDYTKGVFDNRLVVSAGLSNTARIIPRINNPTELVIIEIGEPL